MAVKFSPLKKKVVLANVTSCNIYRLLNFYCEICGASSYGEGRTILHSVSPPYERVPNISQDKFTIKIP